MAADVTNRRMQYAILPMYLNVNKHNPKEFLLHARMLQSVHIVLCTSNINLQLRERPTCFSHLTSSPNSHAACAA